MKSLLDCLILFLLTSCSTTHNIKIIAHRGASGYLPEHTLAAVAMAHSWDVDFIEPDIVLTKDNIPVVLHDIHIDTTTNVAKIFPKRSRSDGRYYAIDFTYIELLKLTVHERVDLKTAKRVFPNRFPLSNINFKIPTLEDYINLVLGLNKTRNKAVGLIPEIKSPKFHKQQGKDITLIVLKLLKKFKLDQKNEQFFLQCFDPQELKRIRFKLNSDINLVQLTGDNSWKEADCDYDQMMTQDGLKEIATYAQVISPWINPLLQTRTLKVFTKTAHSLNLKVIPYTIRVDVLPKGVSEKHLYQILNTSKIDGIFSDFADRLIPYFRQN